MWDKVVHIFQLDGQVPMWTTAVCLILLGRFWGQMSK